MDVWFGICRGAGHHQLGIFSCLSCSSFPTPQALFSGRGLDDIARRKRAFPSSFAYGSSNSIVREPGHINIVRVISKTHLLGQMCCSRLFQLRARSCCVLNGTTSVPLGRHVHLEVFAGIPARRKSFRGQIVCPYMTIAVIAYGPNGNESHRTTQWSAYMTLQSYRTRNSPRTTMSSLMTRRCLVRCREAEQVC